MEAEEKEKIQEWIYELCIVHGFVRAGGMKTQNMNDIVNYFKEKIK